MFIVPSTLSRITARQPFAVIDSAGTKYWPPALLTNTSTPPWRSTASATIRAASAGSRMSPLTQDAPGPSHAHASSSTSWRRPAITTSAPHASSSAAACRPRFVPPPVTIAVWPASKLARKISEGPPIRAGSVWTGLLQWTGMARLRQRTSVSSTLAERLAARDEQRFVGRERELAFFESLFAPDPPAQVVLVHGPGGIGKSTLLREVARRASKRGWTTKLVEGRDLAPVPGEIESALGDVTEAEQPLILFDTYERMSAAGGWLRARLLPSLPARSVVVLAGRAAPEPGWFEGGWERLAVELKLEPLPEDAALTLVRTHGLADGELAQQLIAWADGSPLALTLAADAAHRDRDGGGWAPERIHEHPNLVQAILHRVARTELDGGNLDVVAVAAIARACDARMLRDVLPDVDPEAAYTWLRERTFAEAVRGGVALHEIVRQAMRADLRARDAERDRELRRRIADHLFVRGLRAGTRTIVDLAELVDSPAVRWGFGADGSTTHRPDLWRPEDAPVARERFMAKPSGAAWWATTQPILDQAPDRVVTV